MAKMTRRGSSAPDGRARSWTVVTFEELEAWRQRQGLPKKRVADRLGVTNSTYHNWARGIAVATPATQHKIHALINGAELPDAARAGSRPWNGADASVRDGSAVLSSTAQIVNAYLQSRTAAKLTPEGLCQLIRDVTRALQ
jgi:transcriptional regulator with XRE-family HTH domain